MISIVAYQKIYTPWVTIEMQLPDSVDQGDGHELHCTELATLDGVTYVAVPDELQLPEQPPVLTITPVVLDDELRERIKAASPHCQLIAERMEEKIRARYSISDEQYFARIGVGRALSMYEFEEGEIEELTAFGEHVEAVRAWGRAEREKLGL